MANPEEHILVKNPAGADHAGVIASNLLRDEVLRLQRTEVERATPTVFDLVGEASHAAVYSGLQAPVVGIAQIVDHSTGSKLADQVSIIPAPAEQKFGTALWHAQQIGTAAGIVVPFALTRSAMKSTGLTVATRAEMALASSGRLMSRANAAIVADGALTGFAMDFLMTPVHESEGSFWRARVNNGLTGAATFATLTAGSVTLGHVARPLASEIIGAKRVLLDATLGATSGAPAGAVNADVRSLLTRGSFATGEERAKSAYTMAMVGGTLSAAHRIPGQDGPSALEFQRTQAAKANLESMLAERARAAEVRKLTSSPSPSDAGGKGATEARDSGLKSGRAMASADIVGEGRVVEAQVSSALAPVLQRAINEGMASSEATATPAQVSQFIDYVRTEGAPVKQALLKIAEGTNDQRFLTIVQEASLPPQGVELPARDFRIQPEPGKPVTQDQLNRWQKFADLVAQPPTDSKGYSKFRQDVFEWLNRNPDLHSWAKQFHANSNHSKIVGPLDFYFEGNQLSRFINVRNLNARAPEKNVNNRNTENPVEQPKERVISLDYLNMHTQAREFARQVKRAPYDAQLSENFQALASNMKGMSVGQFALVVNQQLKLENAHNICSVGVKGNELTLYRTKTEKTMDSVGVLDYEKLPRQENPSPGRDPQVLYKIGSDLVRQLQFADTIAGQQQAFSLIVLRLRDAGLVPAEMAYELNYVIRENNAPWTVMARDNNKIELLSSSQKDYKVPIVTAIFNGHR